MSIRCLKSDLLLGLKLLRGCVTGTQMVCMSTEHHLGKEGILKLKSDDAETYMSYTIEIPIADTWKIIVPIEPLIEIFSVIDSDALLLEPIIPHLQIRGKNARYVVWGGSNVFDSWTLPPQSESFTLELSPKLLGDALNHTIFSACTETFRPAFNGIYLQVENGNMTAVSTDGYRLSVYSTGGEIKCSEKHLSVLIPLFTSKLILKALNSIKNESTDTISIEWSSQFIRCTYRNVVLMSRVIEGVTFPKYKQIIPNKYIGSFTVDRRAFNSSLNRAGTIAKHGSGFNRICIHVEGNKLGIEVENEVGSAHDYISIGDVVGSGFNKLFNYKYLLDFGTHVEPDRISVKYFEEQPLLLEYGDSESKSSKFQYVVMPMARQGG